MEDLNLNDGKIQFEGSWLTAGDLKRQIKEKIEVGDMKFARHASALERLGIALENSQRLDVSLVISKEEYEELKSVGGTDDMECVRKAILSFIGYEVEMDGAATVQTQTITEPVQSVSAADDRDGNKTAVRCFKCKSPMEIMQGEDPMEIRCSQCNAVERMDPSPENNVRFKDHFLG